MWGRFYWFSDAGQQPKCKPFYEVRFNKSSRGLFITRLRHKLHAVRGNDITACRGLSSKNQIDSLLSVITAVLLLFKKYIIICVLRATTQSPQGGPLLEKWFTGQQLFSQKNIRRALLTRRESSLKFFFNIFHRSGYLQTWTADWIPDRVHHVFLVSGISAFEKWSRLQFGAVKNIKYPLPPFPPFLFPHLKSQWNHVMCVSLFRFTEPVQDPLHCLALIMPPPSNTPRGTAC